MQTLDRVVRRGSRDVHAIDLPFVGLQRLGFRLGRGQVGMIAAAPGVGKSALAAQVAQMAGLPTLYESPDTDAWTMTVRTMALNSGHPQDYVRMCVEGGHRDDSLDLALWESRHVHFSFDSFSTAEIKDDVLAYAVIHGAYPELIVVDTLLNIAGTGDDEHRQQAKAMEEFHALAQMTGAHVLVLHHVTGSYDDGDKPVPLGGLVNKLSKLPAQILTLYTRGSDVYACPVKNRQGKADPSAQMQVRLHFDKERMTFRDGS
jgi:replicative DNA helicase